MDPATINAHSFQVADPAGNMAPGSVNYDSNFDVASFLPNPALRQGTPYTATITTEATSAAGVHLASPYSYKFTTRTTTDKSPLKVVSVSPGANASCVSASSLIIVTFDEAPDASTVIPNNFVVTGPGGGAVPVKLSTNVTTTQVVLTPTSPLPSGEITVTVNNVGDLADVMMTAPFTSNFSTACTGGGSGGGATTQFEATLFGSEYAINGHVTIDTSGNTTIGLTGAPANTTYTAQFCPALNVNKSVPPACFNLSKLSSDASGNATVKLKFPRPGNWAGDFNLNNSAGNAVYYTYLSYTVTHQMYLSTLLPTTSVNSGAAIASPQNSAGFGTVSYSNGMLRFTLNGGLPNTVYSTSETLGLAVNESNSYQVTTFTTNAQGDGTSTSTQLGAEGDLFEVAPGNPNQTVFIGGFSIP